MSEVTIISLIIAGVTGLGILYCVWNLDKPFPPWKVKTWNKITEKEPQHGQMCVVWPADYVVSWARDWRCFCYNGSRDKFEGNVTHWCPRPPSPKQK